MKEINIDKELKLIPLQLGYAQELFDLIDKNRSYLRKFMGWLDLTQGSKDTEFFINDDIKKRESGTVAYGIFYKSTLVGVISYNNFNKSNKRTEIGYWVSKDLQGRGIITRSVSALVEHGFNNLDLNRIQICCATANIPSQKIPERLGFLREGICRKAEVLYGDTVDHFIYSLIREEYEKMESLV